MILDQIVLRQRLASATVDRSQQSMEIGITKVVPEERREQHIVRGTFCESSEGVRFLDGRKRCLKTDTLACRNARFKNTSVSKCFWTLF